MSRPLQLCIFCPTMFEPYGSQIICKDPECKAKLIRGYSKQHGEKQRSANIKPKKKFYILCLGYCNKMFWSWDKAKNRICPKCTHQNENRIDPRTNTPTWIKM